MKKERFKEIVSSYSSTPEELKSLQKLANDYPFSQIVHLLLANAYKNEDKNNFKVSLSKAALHATDRSILKSLIEHNLVPSEVVEGTIKVVPKTQTKKDANVKEGRIEDAEALRAEVLENLQLLLQTKKEASAWFNDAPPMPVKEKPSKPKKTTKSKSAPKPKTTSKTSSRVKKQSPIIDKFIQEEPKISKNNKTAGDKEDLAKDSGKMRDDVVSESLAKIFASQGKTEKAIEIYKKLIWKLPQKKALFAAQIEKLKKK